MRHTSYTIFFCLFCIIHSAYGSGFGIFTQSASSLGQGSAVVAHTDSPSTIFFNPALMNKLEGTQLEVGTTLLFPEREFKSASTGNTFETRDTVFFPSTFFITHKFNRNLSAGLGVFNPFGLGTDWGGDWQGKYLATNSEMETYNINPVISCQVTPWLSVAAGLDILVLDATLENKIDVSPAAGLQPGALPAIGQRFRGDGTGIGYNIGAAVDLGKDVTLGASYRSEIEVDPKGDVTFDIPNGIPGALSGLFPNTAARTQITLPRQVYAGIAYKGFDPLTMEVGMRWEGWSSFNQLKIDFDQPVAGNTTAVQARNWKDTFAIDFGAKYKLNDTVSLLGGYLYGQNPVPDSTFEPAIPDSDTHLFCVGTDLSFRKFSLALAYAYQLQLDRTKGSNLNDPSGTANGKYSADIHLLAASLTYRF
jgi:long-chain fatty acid transport protein